MRKMFSKNQIAVIAKNVVDNNEVLSRIYWDSDNEYIAFRSDVDMFNLSIDGDLNVISFTNILDENEDSLQDKLDEKQDIPNFAGETTFGADLTNNKIYSSDKTGLTAEEQNSLKENMLYWIRKGYISFNNQKFNISSFMSSSTRVLFKVCCPTYYQDENDQTLIDTLEQYEATLDLTEHTYVVSMLSI